LKAKIFKVQLEWADSFIGMRAISGTKAIQPQVLCCDHTECHPNPCDYYL